MGSVGDGIRYRRRVEQENIFPLQASFAVRAQHELRSGLNEAFTRGDVQDGACAVAFDAETCVRRQGKPVGRRMQTKACFVHARRRICDFDRQVQRLPEMRPDREFPETDGQRRR